jgi:hypothetical protein
MLTHVNGSVQLPSSWRFLDESESFAEPALGQLSRP